MSYLQIEVVGLFILMILFAGFMIWLLVIILKYFKGRELIHTEQLEHAKNKSLRDLQEAQLEIQEQTFIQVSRELHDNVGQFLSLAKLGLSTIDLEKKEESNSGIAEISDILEKSISDLRDISRAMNADLVKKIGLKNAIESQLGFLKRSGKFHIQFFCEGTSVTTNSQKEIILFRILQESLQNILKHSMANEINIFLSSLKNQIKLLIQDNGRGFDVEFAMAGAQKPGGILNMKSRAELINAELKIESVLGSGTQITIITNF